MKEELLFLLLFNMSLNILDEMSPSDPHDVHVLMPTSDPFPGSLHLLLVSISGGFDIVWRHVVSEQLSVNELAAGSKTLPISLFIVTIDQGCQNQGPAEGSGWGT